MSARFAIAIAALVVALSGCNAARGLGQDIENLGLLIQGKKIEKKAPQQQEVVVSETTSVQPVPVGAAAPAEVEVMPLPPSGRAEVYPYPYPTEGAMGAYPPPVPAPATVPK